MSMAVNPRNGVRHGCDYRCGRLYLCGRCRWGLMPNAVSPGRLARVRHDAVGVISLMMASPSWVAYASYSDLSLDDGEQTGDGAGKCIVRFQFSIRAYILLVVYVAGLTTLCKIVPWAIRTYHP